LNVRPRRGCDSTVCRPTRLACWLVGGGEPSSRVGDGGYTGLGEITSGSTYTCGGVSEPCVPSSRRDIIGLSGGASVLDAGLHRATQSSISTLQPSASPSADCRRSDRWILAKTKSALRKVRIPASTTVGWPKLPLGTAGSGTDCTPDTSTRSGQPAADWRATRQGSGNHSLLGTPDHVPSQRWGLSRSGSCPAMLPVGKGLP
jgi:hypothetical protein